MSPLVFAAFQGLSPNGTVGSSWRAAGNTQTDFLNVEHWVQMAQKFEDGGFDFIFFADSFGYPTLNGELLPYALKGAVTVPMADPAIIVAAITAQTKKIGVVITASTTVERPAVLARRLATLDHFTNGRVGWNIVSGGALESATALLGAEMIPHDERYAQADEFLEICMQLWEGSWTDDALRVDRENGVFADPDGVRQVEFEGKYFRSKGILTVPPSPQRTPYLLQAGTSVAGRDFAARNAEAVFVAGEPNVIAGNVTAIRDLAVSVGRSRDSIKFLVGANFVVAETMEEALIKRETMLGFATLDHAATHFAWSTGVDLLAFELDEPLPEIHSEIGQTALDRFLLPDGTRPTVRSILEVWRQNGISGTTFVGTPTSIADEVEAFIAETGADGFLVQQHITPASHDDFNNLLGPELRARGLLRATDEGITLREQVSGFGPHLPESHPGHALKFRRPTNV